MTLRIRLFFGRRGRLHHPGSISLVVSVQAGMKTRATRERRGQLVRVTALGGGVAFLHRRERLRSGTSQHDAFQRTGAARGVAGRLSSADAKG